MLALRDGSSPLQFMLRSNLIEDVSSSSSSSLDFGSWKLRSIGNQCRRMMMSSTSVPQNFVSLPKSFIFQFFYDRQIKIPQLEMQVVEYHLSPIDWFLEFGQDHHKHKLIVDIWPPNPLEPDCLNEC